MRLRRLIPGTGLSSARGVESLVANGVREPSRFDCGHSIEIHKTSNPPLRIIIPAHNEERRLEPTVRDYCEHFGPAATITVVANACTDGTVELVNRLAKEYSTLECIDIAAPIGKGGAIRVGFTIGDEPFVGFVDADHSTSASEFARLRDECVAENVCGVVGSRWKRGARIMLRQSLLRRVASRIFNALVVVMFRLPFADTQCGAKVFRRDAVSAAITELELADFAFDIDLLHNLRLQGCRVIEKPIVWADAVDGTTVVSLGRVAIAMFLGLIRLRIMRSALVSLPYVDLLARRSVIPVKRTLSFLVLVDSSAATNPQRLFMNDTIRSWSEIGHKVTIFDAGAARGLMAAALRRVSYLASYIFLSDRAFDAVIEIRSGFPFFIPAFSVKPRYLIEGRGSQNRWMESLFGMAYSRVNRLKIDEALNLVEVSPRDHEPLRSQHGLEVLIHELCATGHYKATFVRESNNWILRYRDPGTGAFINKKLFVS